MSVVPYQNLPLMPKTRSWDADAAEARVRAWAGAKDGLDSAEARGKYRRAFLWHGEPEDKFGSYKFPIADVQEGELHAVPRGIFAAAGVLQGARGGTTIPAGDQAAMRRHLSRYYAKMRDEFEDDDIQAPWDVKASRFFAEGETGGKTRSLHGVPVFSVGFWKNWKFTEGDLEEIARNTNALIEKGAYKPPLKLGHGDQILNQEDGQPALGYVKNVRVEGTQLLVDITDIPGIVLEAFDAGLWTTRSVELNHLEHIGWVLTGVAMLGADLPAVTDLESIRAYLSAAPRKWIGEPIFHRSVAMSQNQPGLDDKPGLDEQKAELERLRNELKEFHFSDAKRAALQPYQDDVKAMLLPPRMLDKIEAALDSQKLNFVAGAGLTLPPALAREVAMAYREAPRKGEQAGTAPAGLDSEDPPDVRLAREANKIMLEKGLSYEDAAHFVMRSDPALALAYRDQPVKQLGWRGTTNASFGG